MKLLKILHRTFFKQMRKFLYGYHIGKFMGEYEKTNGTISNPFSCEYGLFYWSVFISSVINPVFALILIATTSWSFLSISLVAVMLLLICAWIIETQFEKSFSKSWHLETIAKTESKMPASLKRKLVGFCKIIQLCSFTLIFLQVCILVLWC